MQLILSSSSTPWNTNYCNEAGQVLFKAESPAWRPLVAVGRHIKLSRVVPSSTVGGVDREHLDNSMRDVFAPVGEIEFHVFKHSRIKYRGEDQSVKDFFRTSRFRFQGRPHVFTGPDGKEYIWKTKMTGTNHYKLFLHNPSETPVAKYHLKHLGIFSPKRPASLEIFPLGEHMIELILITFIYVETLQERERPSS